MNHLHCKTIFIIAAFVILAASTGNTMSIKGVPNSNRCTQVSDCKNNECCLNGTCSKTGHARGRCYVDVRENGDTRPSGVWTKTDICPCGYSYYCFNSNGQGQRANKVDTTYGVIGYCQSVMG